MAMPSAVSRVRSGRPQGRGGEGGDHASAPEGAARGPPRVPPSARGPGRRGSPVRRRRCRRRRTRVGRTRRSRPACAVVKTRRSPSLRAPLRYTSSQVASVIVRAIRPATSATSGAAARGGERGQGEFDATVDEQVVARLRRLVAVEFGADDAAGARGDRHVDERRPTRQREAVDRDLGAGRRGDDLETHQGRLVAAGAGVGGAATARVGSSAAGGGVGGPAAGVGGSPAAGAPESAGGPPGEEPVEAPRGEGDHDDDQRQRGEPGAEQPRRPAGAERGAGARTSGGSTRADDRHGAPVAVEPLVHRGDAQGVRRSRWYASTRGGVSRESACP
jgi:hypothetical protein